MRKFESSTADRRPRLRAVLLVTSALAASLCGAAHAQTAAEPAKPENTATVTEVIVTATKRGESVMHVAQTVTAIGEQALKQYNVQSFTDYGNKIPNLSFSEGAIGRASFSSSRGVTIRGIVGANTTALYIDETAIPITQNPRIVDISRIEVLKGPQGTLFGAGAIGGTIRIITKEPSFADEPMRYMVQAGATKHGGSADFGGNIIGNVVLVPDKVAVRVMGFVNHDSGFVTRVFPLSKGVMSSVDDQGASLSYGGSISARVQLTDAFSANLKLLAQEDDYDKGWPIVYRGLTQYDPTSLTVQRDYNVQEYSNNHWYLPALTLNYKGDAFTLTSATSLYDQKSSDREDVSEAMHQVMNSRYGYTFDGGVVGGGDLHTKEFQQEVRGSVDFLRYFSAIGGAYYAQTTTQNDSAKRTISGFSSTAVAKSRGITTDVYFALNTHRVLTEKALFGELSFKPIKQVTLTGGVRRYMIDQDVKQTLQGFAIDANNPFQLPSNTKEKGFSPKFSARYEPDDDTTFYALGAKGFRPGAPGSPPASACLPDLAKLGISAATVAAGYKSDSVWSYEGGLKKSLLDRRLNVTVAGFQTDWKDIQQTVSLPSCGSSFTGNAGAARIRGWESEINGRVNQYLTLRVGLGYTDAKITDDNHGSTGQKIGDRLYGVPKFNATVGGVYTREIRAGLEGFVSADWSYVGDSTTVNNSTTLPQKRGSYAIANARFGVRHEADELSVYVNNITNEMANYGDHVPDISQTIVLYGTTVPYSRVSVSRPFQVGMQLRHGF